MKFSSLILSAFFFCIIPAMCSGQDLKVYKLQTNSGFCTATITFVKGGNFIYERGCEESSKICFGVWRKTGNRITLVPADNKNFAIIRYFEAAPAKDSVSTLKVLDITGKDMSDKMKFTILDTFHKEIQNTGNWAEAAANAKFIRLTTLKNIFETAIDIDNLQARNNIMQLDIPENYIYNPNSVWQLPPVLEYNIESDCLIENDPKNGRANSYCPQ